MNILFPSSLEPRLCALLGGARVASWAKEEAR